MAGIALGDRVIWLGALNADGSEKGGWAGNGKGVIADYEKARAHFQGIAPTERDQPERGPAVGILLDGGDPAREKKYDVWVRPDPNNIIHDTDFKEGDA